MRSKGIEDDLLLPGAGSKLSRRLVGLRSHTASVRLRSCSELLRNSSMAGRLWRRVRTGRVVVMEAIVEVVGLILRRLQEVLEQVVHLDVMDRGICKRS